jgi:integrase
VANARPRLSEFAKRIDLRDDQGRLVQISKTHTFRHTKATNLLNAGVPIHVAMRYMGHKTPGMFLHYANPRELHQMGVFPQVACSARGRSGLARRVVHAV